MENIEKWNRNKIETETGGKVKVKIYRRKKKLFPRG